MPNICQNVVTIVGDEDVIQDLRRVEFDFQHIVPVSPPAGTTATELLRIRDAIWGTQWPHTEYQEIRSGVNGYHITFNTAWTPPLQVLEALLRRYPTLWLKCAWHEEAGCAGVWVGSGVDQRGNPNPSIVSTQWNDLSIEAEYEAFRQRENLPPS
jgi:hypothetical protein